jgi:HlyD family secretion protein
MSKDNTDAAAPSGRSIDVEIRHSDVLPPSSNAVVPAHRALPSTPEQIAPKSGRSRWLTLALLGIVIIGAGGGAAYWWHTRQGGLPLGIVSGNGRIEADEIDIDTKFAGRIVEMDADEGDMLTPQQVVARMDTRDIEATLKKSEAQVQAAQQSLHEAHAAVVQQTTQVTLAQQQFARTSALVT